MQSRQIILVRHAHAEPAEGAQDDAARSLNLGGEARMNFPGTVGSNWTWRVKKGYCSNALAAKTLELTKRYDRTV